MGATKVFLENRGVHLHPLHPFKEPLKIQILNDLYLQALNRCPRLSSSSIILNWLTKSFITVICPIGDDEFFKVIDALIDLQNALETAVCTLRLVRLFRALVERGNACTQYKVAFFNIRGRFPA